MRTGGGIKGEENFFAFPPPALFWRENPELIFKSTSFQKPGRSPTPPQSPHASHTVGVFAAQRIYESTVLLGRSLQFMESYQLSPDEVPSRSRMAYVSHVFEEVAQAL